MTPDGRPKLIIDRKFYLCTLIFLVSLVGYICYRINRRPHVYQNCAQIKLATGRSYIKANDSLYQSRLDKTVNGQKNGIACE